jgi:hypothetical protein
VQSREPFVGDKNINLLVIFCMTNIRCCRYVTEEEGGKGPVAGVERLFLLLLSCCCCRVMFQCKKGVNAEEKEVVQ